MLTRTLLTKLTLLLALSLTSFAAAAAPPADPDELESAIQAGIELRKAGSDAAALDLFIKLDRENPGSVRLMLQVTAAAQASGRWLVAYQYLRKAAAFKGDPYYQRNRAAIQGVEDAVAQHVGQFRVVGEPSGAEVRLSGNLVGTLPMVEPTPVQLGSYTLEVSKPGYYQLERVVTIVAGGALNQEVVELKPRLAPAEPRTLALSTGQPGSGADTALPARSWWRSRSLTWVLGGVTLAAAATTGGALWVREHNADRWNDDSKCLDRRQAERTREDVCGSERSTAQTAGSVALGAGIATAVFASATLTQWLLSTGGKAPEGSAHAASCAAGLGSVTCSGTF